MDPRSFSQFFPICASRDAGIGQRMPQKYEISKKEGKYPSPTRFVLHPHVIHPVW